MRALREQLASEGYLELASGLPRAWAWRLFDFVESCYDRFGPLVVQELELLRPVWAPCSYPGQRHGAFAAMKASERLAALGVAIYSPGESQTQKPPYRPTGPRWYVSITSAALREFGASLAAPSELYELLCGHSVEHGRDLRARGLGWTLAPPGSDPQMLHADLWGTGAHRRTDRTRWPHILWKRRPSELCTTELVPGAFTRSCASEANFQRIKRVRSPAIVVDSECLHRGAATPPKADGASDMCGWASTLSLELCTASGWDAWEDFSTGGTFKDVHSSLDWRMLRIGPPSAEQEGAGAAPVGRPPGLFELRAAELPPAPWSDPSGMAALKQEQLAWELGS